MKYSEGPWRVEDNGDGLEIWNNSHFIATPRHGLFFSAQKFKLDVGNCNLIAQAPEMFQLLKEISERIELANSPDLLNRIAVIVKKLD